MTLPSWVVPVLLREHDWRAALTKLGTRIDGRSPKAQRTAVELARASEYIEPDRRRAIALYELGGPDGDLWRARELATELGWWSGRARLTLVARQPADPPDATPRARRIAVPIDVRLVKPDGTHVDGHCRDISTSGLFVLTSVVFEVGIEVMLVLLLPGPEAFSEDEYRAKARVVRHTPEGCGIELVGPDAALLAALAAL